MGAFRWFVLFISIGFFNPVVAMVVEAKRKKAMVEEEGIEMEDCGGKRLCWTGARDEELVQRLSSARMQLSVLYALLNKEKEREVCEKLVGKSRHLEFQVGVILLEQNMRK